MWVRSIGSRPRGRHPHIGLHLADGQLIEGPLHSYTFGAEAGKREIALSGPIRITAAGQSTPHEHPHLDRLVVPESKISLITVHHAPTETR